MHTECSLAFNSKFSFTAGLWFAAAYRIIIIIYFINKCSTVKVVVVVAAAAYCRYTHITITRLSPRVCTLTTSAATVVVTTDYTTTTTLQT